MNDRFKFRFWNKSRKIMETFNGFSDAIGDILTNEIKAEPYIIMQCTGLKDKNGTLIYEGDILGGIYENLDIFYCPQCMQFELHAKDYGCMCCNGDIYWYELVEPENENELEVIGNIYENKELLDERN